MIHCFICAFGLCRFDIDIVMITALIILNKDYLLKVDVAIGVER